MNSLGRAFFENGDSQPAARHLLRAWELRKKGLGETHGDSIESQTDVAMLEMNDNRLDQSITHLEQVVAASTSDLGPGHPLTIARKNSLAEAYLTASRHADASPLIKQVLEIGESDLPTDHPERSKTLILKGWLGLQRDPTAELPQVLIRHGLAQTDPVFVRDWLVHHAKALLGEALAKRQDSEAAERYLLEAYDGMSKHRMRNYPLKKTQLSNVTRQLKSFYESAGRGDEADRWRKIEQSLGND